MAELCPVFFGFWFLVFGFWVGCGSLCFIKVDITNMYCASIKILKAAK